MHNKLIAVSFIILIAFVSSAKAQKKVNSPYSRFNIGTFEPAGSFRSLAMGGTGVAIRDNSSIYIANPASYCSLDTTSMVFDFGMDYSVNVLTSGTDYHKSDDNNFDHIFMGFPIAKGWGFTMGILPITNGYYSLTQTIKAGDPGYDPLTGNVYSTHKGSGGLNNVFVGTGLNLSKNFAVGVNLNIAFGTIDRLNQFEFEDYANSFSEYGSQKLRLGSVHFDYGVQYHADLKNDYFINAGFTFTPSKKYMSEMTQLVMRYAAYSTSLYSPDTLVYSSIRTRDSTKFPSTYKFGVAIGKKDKFIAAFDYIISNWTKGVIQGNNPGYLADSKSLQMGLEFIPDKYSNTSYLSRVEYRLGGRMTDSYLMINGTRIKEYGASCGVGLRIGNTQSKTNLYFEYSKRNGDLERGLHNETIYTIGISLNLYDYWFRKKKYD